MSFKKFTVAVLCTLLSLSSAQNIRGAANASIQCTPESRIGEMCMLVVQPVCGYRPDIVCSTNDPITCNYNTFSNACEACHDPSVASYTKGACPETVSPANPSTPTNSANPAQPSEPAQ